MSAYAILELPDGSTAAEVKKAYRRLAMHWHPDRNKAPGAEEKFKRIKAAHDFLLKGKGSAAQFEQAPPPHSKPASAPTPPDPRPSSRFDDPRSIPKTIVSITVNQLFGAEVAVPHTPFRVSVPYGVVSGQTVRTRILHNGMTYVYDITYHVTGDDVYTIRQVRGVPHLFMKLDVSIAQVLAESTIYVKNINPAIDAAVAVELKLTPSGIIEIPYAGLPSGKVRTPLMVDLKVTNKNLDAEQYHVLQELQQRVAKALQASTPDFARKR